MHLWDILYTLIIIDDMREVEILYVLYKLFINQTNLNTFGLRGETSVGKLCIYLN